MALKIRGTLPPYVVKRLRRDRNGIHSGTVVRFFKVGDVNQRIDLAWLDPRLAPSPWGLPCTDVSAEVQPPVCAVTYTYEGVEENFTFTDDDVTFELDTSMNEEPIETHPAFDQLKKLYGWDQAERMFAEQVPDQSGTTGLSGKKNKGRRSEMFGVDSWLAVGAVYRRTYASRSIPGDILKGIGTIIKRPPDIAQFRLPADARKRNWLKLAPKVSRTGNAVRISEEFMLSGPNGWVVPVYSAGQLGDA